ncbi:hypothetical protein SDC9_189957 [bioreactor metagenome]|uniref:Uncharacterized protein n=1 Tax=bioreactor metagenome TaxID=1076179 RepID=A0A645HU59_9ZZZZ
MVVNSPICPPASVPSAITASAPTASIFFAKATEGTTGITFIPCSFKLGIYFPGLPAPVVITGTFSLYTNSIISSAKGDRSITFTP